MDLNDKGIKTQLDNASAAAGLPLDDMLIAIRTFSGDSHTQARARVQELWGLSLMHADTLVYAARHVDVGVQEAAAAWYEGKKALFRPIHDALCAAVGQWQGVELVAKKTYVSARVSKQFATWGAATASRFEIGLNGRHLATGTRLMELPPGQICHAKVIVNSIEELDDEVWQWLRSAWEGASARD